MQFTRFNRDTMLVTFEGNESIEEIENFFNANGIADVFTLYNEKLDKYRVYIEKDEDNDFDLYMFEPDIVFNTIHKDANIVAYIEKLQMFIFFDFEKQKFIIARNDR